MAEITNDPNISNDVPVAAPEVPVAPVAPETFGSLAPVASPSKTSKLFNKQTLKSEALPFDAIPSAIQSGTHAYKKNAKLFVKDPETDEAYEVSGDKLQQALAGGLKLESPSEAAIREYVADNSNLGGAAKVFLRKAADEALLGVPGAIEQRVADPLDLAKRKALEEEYSGTGLAGTIAGFGAGIFTGAAELKAGAKAFEKIAGKELAEKAAGLITAKSGEGVATTIAKTAADWGVQGVALSAPKALTEASLGSPDAAAQTLISGGLTGAIFGAGAGSAGQVYKSAKKIYQNSISNAEAAKTTAYQLAGLNAEQITKLQRTAAEVDNNLPTFLAEIGQENPRLISNPKMLSEAVNTRLEQSGQQIDAIVNKVDEIVGSYKGLSDDAGRADINAKFPDLNKPLKEIADEFVIPNRPIQNGKVSYAPGMEAQVKEVERYLQDFADYTLAKYHSNQPTTLRAIVDLKRMVGSTIKRGENLNTPLLNEALESLEAKLVRTIGDDVAINLEKKLPDKLTGMADDLRKSNLDYATAANIDRSISKKASREMLAGSRFDLTDVALSGVAKNAKTAAQYLLAKQLLISTKDKLKNEALININKGLKAQAQQIDDIPKYLNGEKSYIPEAAKGKLPQLFKELFNVDHDDKHKNYEETYKQISDKLGAFVTNPTAASEAIANVATPFSDEAPLTAQSMNAFLIQNLNYMQNMMPKPPSIPNPIFKTKAWAPSDRDMYKFARKLEVVNNPMVLISNLQDGTLSQDEVKVASDLYPEVLKKIQQQVLNYVATKDAVIPYSDRLKYSLLLGMDSDPSVAGAFIFKMQETYVNYLENPPLEEAQSPRQYKAEDLSTSVSRFNQRLS